MVNPSDTGTLHRSGARGFARKPPSPIARTKTSKTRTRRKKEEEYGQPDHVTTHVRQDRRHHRCGSRGVRRFDAHRAGRRDVQQRVRQRHRGRENVLPRLRQDGVRRQGHRPERAGHTRRRGRGSVPVHGQLLHEVAVVHPGGVPPRPPALSHEAHEPEGRGARLAAYLVGRGHAVHRGQLPGHQSQARRRGYRLPGGHVAHLVHALGVHPEEHAGNAEQRGGLADLQRPAPLRHHHGVSVRHVVDGNHHAPEGVRAVGRRVRAVQLRRLLPHHRGRGVARRRAHQRRPPHGQHGQGSRLLAAPAPRHRRCPGTGLDERHHREEALRRSVREEVDERPVPRVRGHGAVRLPHRAHRRFLLGRENRAAQGKRHQGGRQPLQVPGVRQQLGEAEGRGRRARIRRVHLVQRRPGRRHRRDRRLLGRRELRLREGTARPRGRAGQPAAGPNPGLDPRSHAVRPRHRSCA